MNEIMGIKPGDKVDYHSIIEGPITSKDHTVGKVLPMPNNFGRPVAWITGKSGCVAVSSLSKADMVPCSKCGTPQDENWPAEKEGFLCQECWENECSSSWLRMMKIISFVVEKDENIS